jgi:hypothetical protein
LPEVHAIAATNSKLLFAHSDVIPPSPPKKKFKRTVVSKLPRWTSDSDSDEVVPPQSRKKKRRFYSIRSSSDSQSFPPQEMNDQTRSLPLDLSQKSKR